jgi:hypothetical protein
LRGGLAEFGAYGQQFGQNPTQIHLSTSFASNDFRDAEIRPSAIRHIG